MSVCIMQAELIVSHVAVLSYGVGPPQWCPMVLAHFCAVLWYGRTTVASYGVGPFLCCSVVWAHHCSVLWCRPISVLFCGVGPPQ